MNKEQFGAISLPFELCCVGINPEVIYKVLSMHFGAMILHRVVSDKTNLDFPLPVKYTKYILRPLSDLTKPIEHNGEKFVPIEILKEVNDGDDIYISEYGVSIDNGYAAGYNLNTAFEFIFKLTEWHFDIAGLIEKGEAIDVNTLPENPYK